MAAQVRQPLREARSRMQGSRSVSHPSLDFSGGRRLCPDSPATCIDLFVWYQETGFFLVLRRDGNGGVAVVEKRCFILWPATTTNNLSPCLRDFNFFFRHEGGNLRPPETSRNRQPGCIFFDFLSHGRHWGPWVFRERPSLARGLGRVERQHRLDAWHLPRTSCVDFHGKISVLEEMESKALGRGDTFLTILRNSNRLSHDENENSYDLCD